MTIDKNDSIICITTSNTNNTSDTIHDYCFEKGGFIMDKKKVIKFTLITYVIAWLIQIPAAIYYINHQGAFGKSVFQVGAAISMFAPLLATLITNHTLKGMGWKPNVKGNVKWIIFAILVPVIIVVTGAVLFYSIYPDLFDPTASLYLKKTGADMGVDLLGQLEEKGVSPQTYVVISAFSALTGGSFFNMFVAVGEEAGWRGFLYPELRKGFGRVTTWIIAGIIWAAFHFPLMLIAGYEYGTDYLGAPVLGLIVFSVNCIVNGALHEIVYDKTKCIWFSALFHGAINAWANIPFALWNINADGRAEKLMILGPAANGLIGMIPLVIITVIMAAQVLRDDKKIEISELTADMV